MLLIYNIGFADVRFMSNGVGVEGRQQNHDHYSVKFMFFVTSGAYLADVNIRLLSADNTLLLDTKSSGPWFFVDLTPGEYKAIARRSNGNKQSIKFTVAGDRQQVFSLKFPD